MGSYVPNTYRPVPVHTGSGSYQFRFIPVPVHMDYGFRFRFRFKGFLNTQVTHKEHGMPTRWWAADLSLAKEEASKKDSDEFLITIKLTSNRNAGGSLQMILAKF